MKHILIWSLSAVLGIVLGGLSALWMGGMLPGSPRLGNAIDINGWISDWSIGSVNADPYVRARVAKNGLMGLAKEEAVYFMKYTDDAGEPLREACTYRVSSGGAFPADWWSVTLYDSDNRLPMNTYGKLSIDQTQTEYMFESPDEWWFEVTPTEPDDFMMPWVSSKNAGNFDLTLRLYRPSAALLAAPETTLTPPTVERLSCKEGDA